MSLGTILDLSQLLQHCISILSTPFALYQQEASTAELNKVSLCFTTHSRNVMTLLNQL